MKRTTILALAAALTGSGCVDLGLEGNAIPEQEAAVAAPSDLVAAVHAPSGDAELIVDSRPWVMSGMPVAAPLQPYTPVGSAMGRTVFARSWDDRPYDELFARIQGAAATVQLRAKEWQGLQPVLGGDGSSLGGAARDHGEAGADPAH